MSLPLFASIASTNLIPVPPVDLTRRGATINKLEDILKAAEKDLLFGRALSIPYRPRPRASARYEASGTLKFPSKRLSQDKKFVQLYKIMKLSYAALCAGTVITKRSIYYQDKDLFRRQEVVDTLVDDLAFTLGVERHCLHIVAAGKGLITGPITLFAEDKTFKDCADPNGTLIPHIETLTHIDLRTTKWLLVIEKEATFTTLSQAGYWRGGGAASVASLVGASWAGGGGGDGILITGKGYPDLATSRFLSALHKMAPSLPMYALVDFDPDGIAIMRMYRHGSRGLAHEDAGVGDRLEWLGIKSGHVAGFVREDHHRPGPGSGGREVVSIRTQVRSSHDAVTALSGGDEEEEEEDSSSPVSLLSEQTLLSTDSSLPPSPPPHPPYSVARQTSLQDSLHPLTPRDRKRARGMLCELCAGLDGDPHAAPNLECARELQVLLVLGIKAEIQAVDHMGDVTEWLDRELGRASAAARA